MEDAGGKSGRRPGRHLQVEASGLGDAAGVQQRLAGRFGGKFEAEGGCIEAPIRWASRRPERIQMCAERCEGRRGDKGVRRKVCGKEQHERVAGGAAAADRRAPPSSPDPRGPHSMCALRLKKRPSSSTTSSSSNSTHSSPASPASDTPRHQRHMLHAAAHGSGCAPLTAHLLPVVGIEDPHGLRVAVLRAGAPKRVGARHPALPDDGGELVPHPPALGHIDGFQKTVLR